MNPTFTWVRLAQRIPVRIRLTQVLEGVLVSAGMTCRVIMKDGMQPIGASMKYLSNVGFDGRAAMVVQRRLAPGCAASPLRARVRRAPGSTACAPMRRRWARRSGRPSVSHPIAELRQAVAISAKDAFSSYYAGSRALPARSTTGSSTMWQVTSIRAWSRSCSSAIAARWSRPNVDWPSAWWRRWLSISRTFPLSPTGSPTRSTHRLESKRATRVTMVHAVPAPSGTIDIVERALLPFDFTRFHVTPSRIPPIVTLPPEQLLDRLAEEYVYAELCAAVMLSYAAENEARMQAMIAARSNVERKLDELTASYRNLRQEEITAEIIELSAGTLARTDSVAHERPQVEAQA